MKINLVNRQYILTSKKIYINSNQTNANIYPNLNFKRKSLTNLLYFCNPL